MFGTLYCIRKLSSYLFDLPDNWVGDTVHTWVGMVDAEGKKCSSSVYLGAIALV